MQSVAVNLRRVRFARLILLFAVRIRRLQFTAVTSSKSTFVFGALVVAVTLDVDGVDRILGIDVAHGDASAPSLTRRPPGDSLFQRTSRPASSGPRRPPLPPQMETRSRPLRPPSMSRMTTSTMSLAPTPPVDHYAVLRGVAEDQQRSALN